MLLLLEGADGAGKTTLSQQLEQRLHGPIFPFHHGPYPGASGREMASALVVSMRPAFNQGATAVVDRCWVSEPIYAEVYHKTPPRISVAQRRMLDRVALAADGVVVLCLPPLEVCLKAFTSGRDEMMESTEQLRQVYDLYCQPLNTQLPVVTYDYTRDSVADLLNRVDNAIKLRHSCIKAFLIGDRPNTRTHAQSDYQVPFVSFTGAGCSEWLAEQLEQAGVSEVSLHWLNAYTSDGTPVPVPDFLDAEVFALGNHATEWCSANKLKFTQMPHPQAHKRLYSNIPYPLITKLKELHNA